MNHTKLEKIIFNRIKKSTDISLVLASLTSFVSAIIIYFGNISLIYVIIDLLLGVFYLLSYVIRKKISTRTKIKGLVLLPIVLGIVIFLDGGFSGGTILLFVIGNSLSMLLLRENTSLAISMFSILSFVGLWIWSYYSKFDVMPEMTFWKWCLQVILMMVFLFLFRISINSIKRYMNDNILDLESSVRLTAELAYKDNLTGLPNYNYFNEQLENYNGMHDKSGVIFLLSIKNMNMINVVYGDDLGNKLIICISNRIRSCDLDYNLVARVNSKEFGFWIQEEKESNIQSKMNKILEELSKEIKVEDFVFNMEYYLSYAKMDFCENDFKQSYKKARVALTFARYSEKSMEIVSYNKKIEKDIIRKSELKDLLKQDILLDKNFSIYFQPQIRTVDGSIKGVEVLSRWNTEKYGNITPSEFIPLIEQLNMHVEFGIFVIKKVIAQYNEIVKKYTKDIRISVNIAPSFLRIDNFSQVILNTMENTFLNLSNITLEITEETVIEGVEFINKKLAPLRQRGIKISLDDFGTGFSSLSYLAKLEVDEIKLDKSLIDQIINNRKSVILIETLIGLTKNYNMEIVAEGVEEEQQYMLLKKLNCGLIQGYFTGKPMPLTTILL